MESEINKPIVIEMNRKDIHVNPSKSMEYLNDKFANDTKTEQTELSDTEGHRMKVYIKCEKCSGHGWLFKMEDAGDPCPKCKNGYVEIEIPVEQALEALKEFKTAEWMVTHDWGGDRQSVIKKAEEVIKALEECIKLTQSNTL